MVQAIIQQKMRSASTWREHPDCPDVPEARQYWVKISEKETKGTESLHYQGLQLSGRAEGNTAAVLARQAIETHQDRFDGGMQFLNNRPHAHRVPRATPSQLEAPAPPQAAHVAEPAEDSAVPPASSSVIPDLTAQFSKGDNSLEAQIARLGQAALLKQKAKEDEKARKVAKFQKQKDDAKRERERIAQLPVTRAKKWVKEKNDKWAVYCRDEIEKCKSKSLEDLDHGEMDIWAKKFKSVLDELDDNAQKLEEFIDQGEDAAHDECMRALDLAGKTSSEFKRQKGLYEYLMRSNKKTREAKEKARHSVDE